MENFRETRFTVFENKSNGIFTILVYVVPGKIEIETVYRRISHIL